jgi:hypothetical protein
MRITDVGLARVKESYFKQGLAKLVGQMVDAGKTDDEIFHSVSVFTSMELCADENGFVALPEGDAAEAVEITNFMNENVELIRSILLLLQGSGVSQLPN